MFVYEQGSGGWALASTINQPEAISADIDFGIRAALAGDVCFVTGGTNLTNTAYVLEYDGTDWALTDSLEAGTATMGTRYVVDAGANSLVLACATGADFNSGWAKIYEAPGLSWVKISVHPSTAPVTVDGREMYSPAILQWEPGSSHSVSVPAETHGDRLFSTSDTPLPLDPIYEFDSWSDGGARAHQVVASDDMELSARYATSPSEQFQIWADLAGDEAVVDGAQFGAAVDVIGDWAAVGAPGIGKAYVFNRADDGSWSLHQTLESVNGPDFGTAVSFASGNDIYLAAVSYTHLTLPTN